MTKFDLCGTKVKAIERSEIPPRLCWRETHCRALDCFPELAFPSSMVLEHVETRCHSSSVGYVISASERHASQLMSMKQYAASALSAVSCRNPSRTISDERIGRMVDRRCRSMLHNERYPASRQSLEARRVERFVQYIHHRGESRWIYLTCPHLKYYSLPSQLQSR